LILKQVKAKRAGTAMSPRKHHAHICIVIDKLLFSIAVVAKVILANKSLEMPCFDHVA